MEDVLIVDAYSNEDICDFLGGEKIWLGERAFKDEDYKQALVCFEEARHLCSADKTDSIVAWIKKCNLKLGIVVEVQPCGVSTTSTAKAGSQKGCSLQSG